MFDAILFPATFAVSTLAAAFIVIVVIITKVQDVRLYKTHGAARLTDLWAAAHFEGDKMNASYAVHCLEFSMNRSLALRIVDRALLFLAVFVPFHVLSALAIAMLR